MSGSIELASDANKRQRILRASRAVFARRGFDAARMQEVAGEAHVSKGTLYRFFRSKEDLLLATVLDSFHEAAGAIDAREGVDASVRARLAARLEALAAALPALSAHMSVNFQAWGVAARDPEARARLFSALRAVHGQRLAELLEILEGARREGLLRVGVDPSIVAMVLLAVFDGLLYRSIFDPKHADGDALRAAFTVLVDAWWTREPRAPDVREVATSG